MHKQKNPGAVMIAYYSFYVYLLMMSGSLFVGMVSIRRKNVEQALTMLIVVLLALIGLSSNLNEWYRVFAGIHHIMVDSWG
jgi:hypothetical protein